ncbi:hypothetical protein [Rheinheimera nanhaiensis]|uniref:hypothetical protein n=1 Tax=Rheinheimera nanhaiensis TaxID=1163621 RepID=UPI000590FDAF|nr:hypothetical protein [Rheinheimera nanhaiensis]
MTKAEEFVHALYSKFDGRVPFAAGYARGFANKIYPLVYENENGIPISLLAVAANSEEDTSEVQLFLISSFKPGVRHGKEMMNYLCNLADALKVKIYLQAEVQFSDRDTLIGKDLVDWYKQFGFTGSCVMKRLPNA